MGSSLLTVFKATRDNSHRHSRWLMMPRSSTSATSTIGMAKARSISSSLERGCMPLALTSPRRSVLVWARLMRRERSLPSMMMLFRRLRMLLPPQTHREGTMMLAELDNILCNLGDEVPKEDVQKLFAELCD